MFTRKLYYRICLHDLPLLLFIVLCYSCRSSQETVFVILPDTQTYLESCPEILKSQFDWIIKNRKGIDAVIHVGDLTQDNHPVEWMLLSEYFGRVEQIGLPYTFSLGNHDIGSQPGKFADTHNTTQVNTYFPVSRLSANPGWGGCFPYDSIDNHYIRLKAGGYDWLIMSLEFGPSDEILEWADGIIGANRESLVIINTHAYLYADSTRMSEGDWWRPQAYGIGRDTTRTVNDGSQIWDKLVSRHSNILAVFCGHVLKNGVGTLVSCGEDGNPVYQMLANFQRGVEGSYNGGNGYLRIITFNGKKRIMNIETYSTWEDIYHPLPEHHFTFEDIDYSKYIKNKK